MPRKVIRLGKEAQESVSKGIDIVADAVKLTLGPDGVNAQLGIPYQTPEITNDGLSVAMEMWSDDEIENDTIRQVQSMAREIYKTSGDGTTTGITFGQAVKNAGLQAQNSGDAFVKIKRSGMSVMNEIFEARDNIIAELDKMAVPIRTKEEVERIAFVSVENRKTAQMIAEMYNIIGKDGSITIEDGYDGIESELTDGFEIEAGFFTDTFANSSDKTFTEINPLFLVTNQKIEFEDQISGIATELYNRGVKHLILVADDISSDMNDQFLASKLTGTMVIVPVKAPFFGKKEKMKDIAVALGATFFDRESGKPLSQATFEDLGTAKHVKIDTDKCIVKKPHGNTKEYVALLREELKSTKDRFDREVLAKRIAKVSGRIGIIRIGGDDATRAYLRKKIQNAVNACKYALQEGVVRGGGLTLKHLSETLPKNILTEALLSPYSQIQDNSGGNLAIGEDIIDPVKTTKTAVKYACDIAGLAITVKIAIADKFEKEKDYTGEE